MFHVGIFLDCQHFLPLIISFYASGFMSQFVSFHLCKSLISFTQMQCIHHLTMCFFGWFLLVRLTSSQMYPEVTWDTFVVCLKVFSRNSREDEGLHIYGRFRFHDCIFRTALKTKNMKPAETRPKEKKAPALSTYIGLVLVVCVHLTDALGRRLKKQNSFSHFLTFKMFVQMEKIILQTALGKCFNKPPIMPCRLLWTRSKIHTISFYFFHIFK